MSIKASGSPSFGGGGHWRLGTFHLPLHARCRVLEKATAVASPNRDVTLQIPFRGGVVNVHKTWHPSIHPPIHSSILPTPRKFSRNSFHSYLSKKKRKSPEILLPTKKVINAAQPKRNSPSHTQYHTRYPR